MNQKGFSTIILALFVAGLLGLMGVFYYSERQKNVIQSQQIINTPQDTIHQVNAINSPSSRIVSTWQTKQINITKNNAFNFSDTSESFFNISVPSTYSIEVDSKAADTLRIYDEQKEQVLSIYNYAGGERSPKGSIVIDGVPFTLDYYNEIKCLSDISPTNWQPGTPSLLTIHVDCNEATSEQLKTYTMIIKNMKFNPTLKKTLLGK